MLHTFFCSRIWEENVDTRVCSLRIALLLLRTIGCTAYFLPQKSDPAKPALILFVIKALTIWCLWFEILLLTEF